MQKPKATHAKRHRNGSKDSRRNKLKRMHETNTMPTKPKRKGKKDLEPGDRMGIIKKVEQGTHTRLISPAIFIEKRRRV